LGPHNKLNHEYFDALSTLRTQLGLQGSAHFLAELWASYLPDAVISDFYRIADALILTSREEGFGIPLIEAAFSHLPVFCADIPPLRELGLSDALFFSPDGSPAVLASSIADHFKSSMPSRFAMRARTLFRWETIYQVHIAPMLIKG
jgi:glycosyltransferase involved in cell wall biosynthesis